MQRARLAFLSKISTPKKILIVGEGPGSFLVACRKKFPEAAITCLDASSIMLGKTKQTLQLHNISLHDITFLHRDALLWQPQAATYDLIVTHFFLDCFTRDELELLIPILSKAAAKKADWLIADFQIPCARVMKKISQFLVKILYLFFREVADISATELVSSDHLLKKNGFQLLQRKESSKGLLKSDWWRLE